MNCTICNGEAEQLGELGHTTHYRCRDCGMIFGITEAPAKKEVLPPQVDRAANDVIKWRRLK